MCCILFALRLAIIASQTKGGVAVNAYNNIEYTNDDYGWYWKKWACWRFTGRKMGGYLMKHTHVHYPRRSFASAILNKSEKNDTDIILNDFIYGRYCVGIVESEHTKWKSSDNKNKESKNICRLIL